jgi:methyl-accepting chemotaxis protein
MKSSLTVRALIVFLGLDLVVGAVVLWPFTSLLFPIDPAAARTTVLGFVALRLLVTAVVLNRQLGAFDRLERAEGAPRSSADVLAADRAVQGFPMRFGVYHALSWVTVLAVAVWVSRSVAEVATIGGADLALVAVLAISAVGLGAFAVAFPLSVQLTTDAATACFAAARRASIALDRPPASFEARIVMVVSAVALAPALWATALGFRHGVEGTASAAPDIALFVLFVLVWAVVSAIALGRIVSGPIRRLTAAARVIVEEGRLSQMEGVAIAREDDVGELSTYFNRVLGLMRSLGEAANAVAKGDLLFRIDGKGDLPDAFRGMLESLAGIVRQIRSTSVELGSAAAELFAAAQEQESAATAQSSAMVEISRTMESLSLSAAHVSEAVSGVLGNAERTLQNTDDMVERIGALTRLAGRIGEILEVIRDIADRSDLLALNGSLEASRAGEAGRGFSLVAGEMRRLAERVTASVQDVKKLVSDIRDSGSSTVIATEESRKLADGTTEAARQITFVSQQQRSGTEQVSQSVKNIADVVSQAASATSEIRTAAEGLKAHADRLSELVRGFQTSGQETA